MTSTLSAPGNELLSITGTIGQGMQASTAAFRFLRSFDKNTRAALVLLLSIVGLVWALNHFSTKR
jgi:hypothetical protein